MNTGFVRPAVATVLTVYGIETLLVSALNARLFKLQQYLPFTVLKPARIPFENIHIVSVATVLTVYGIETR